MWKNEIKNLTFLKIWRHSYFFYFLPHHSDVLHKLLHNVLKTNDYTYKCTRDKSSHPIAITANKKKTFYTYLQTAPEYQKSGNTTNGTIKSTKNQFTSYQHILTISSNYSNSKTKKLIITLIQSIIYQIWHSRNKIKYDKIALFHTKMINKINKQVQTIINVHYKRHKMENT